MEANEKREGVNRDDFIEAMEGLDDLTQTEQIADHLDCDEGVVRERIFKLKDEGEVISKPDGAGGWIWAKKSG
jgi:predicted transcriptional regulator